MKKGWNTLFGACSERDISYIALSTAPYVPYIAPYKLYIAPNIAPRWDTAPGEGENSTQETTPGSQQSYRGESGVP